MKQLRKELGDYLKKIQKDEKEVQQMITDLEAEKTKIQPKKAETQQKNDSFRKKLAFWKRNKEAKTPKKIDIQTNNGTKENIELGKNIQTNAELEDSDGNKLPPSSYKITNIQKIQGENQTVSRITLQDTNGKTHLVQQEQLHGKIGEVEEMREEIQIDDSITTLLKLATVDTTRLLKDMAKKHNVTKIVTTNNTSKSGREKDGDTIIIKKGGVSIEEQQNKVLHAILQYGEMFTIENIQKLPSTDQEKFKKVFEKKTLNGGDQYPMTQYINSCIQ